MLKKTDNDEIILYALDNVPSIILDCANAANPHRFFGKAPEENFRQAYVVPVDAIYRFRDTLKVAGNISRQHGAKVICITSFDYLFNYQDEEENKNVIEHCWELILQLDKEFTVVLNPREKFVPVF